MHQENANVKQFKLRIPMTLFRQLQKDAEAHGMDVSEWARHVLTEAEAKVELTPDDFMIIAEMVAKNAQVINNPDKKKRARK